MKINVLGIFFTVISFTCEAVQEQKRPNIIFIMADDHCDRAIGAYGGRLAVLDPTPNLDSHITEPPFSGESYLDA